MKNFSLFIILLSLCTSCGQEKVQESEEMAAMKKKQYSADIVSLTNEDVSLLEKHDPQVMKKIHQTLPLSIDDIVHMQHLGFTSDTMISLISHTKTRFQLTTSDVIKLQAEGVPFRVINFMIRT